MAYTPGNTGTKLDENFENDLLAIADTRLVLGNWYAECVMNGRSLPDFAAILGMCTSNYGHTRAIYQFLAAHGHDYAHLERGRDAAAICSMNILDEAPAGWEDFIVSTWLTELATWMLASGFLKHEDRAIAGIAKKDWRGNIFPSQICSGLVPDHRRRQEAIRDCSRNRSRNVFRLPCSGSARRPEKTLCMTQVFATYR